MGFLKFLSLLFLLAHVYSADFNVAVEKAFIENEVVPTVIKKPPPELLKVSYDDSAVVQLGNQLPVLSVLHQPTFEWDAEPNTYYTLMMVGYPVEPERNLPIALNVKHMLLNNIKGNDVKTATASAPYIPPSPPPDGGLQRYTFLLYRQASRLSANPLSMLVDSVDRSHFNVTEFAKQNNLELVRGNFFVAGTI